MRHDPFSIFAIFVFRICVAAATATSAVATNTPAVATTSSTVATAVASTPGTDDGYQLGDLGCLCCALLFKRGDQRIVTAGGGGDGNDFGGWHGGGRIGRCGNAGVQLVLDRQILAIK